MKNKTGYSVLKLRLLIVLIIIGSYSYVGLNLWNKYHHVTMVSFLGFTVLAFCVAFLLSPIKINHNGLEQSV